MSTTKPEWYPGDVGLEDGADHFHADLDFRPSDNRIDHFAKVQIFGTEEEVKQLQARFIEFLTAPQFFNPPFPQDEYEETLQDLEDMARGGGVVTGRLFGKAKRMIETLNAEAIRAWTAYAIAHKQAMTNGEKAVDASS